MDRDRGVYMAIFVIVKIQHGEYQLRLHPDRIFENTGTRPNHSQLTQGSRVLALIGSTGGSDSLSVYAAGEIYFKEDRTLAGVTAKTGHYYDQTADFDTEVFATVKRMIETLGYATVNVAMPFN
jgi:hypothetical protein